MRRLAWGSVATAALVVSSCLVAVPPCSAQAVDQPPPPVDPGAAFLGAIVGGVVGAAVGGAFNGGHHKGLDKVVPAAGGGRGKAGPPAKMGGAPGKMGGPAQKGMRKKPPNG